MGNTEFVAKRGRPEAHPWSDWLSGEERLIVRGVDFSADLDLDVLIGTIRRKAKVALGRKITAKKVGDSAIRFRVLPKHGRGK